VLLILGTSGPLAASQEAAPTFLDSSCATACHGAERTQLEGSVHALALTCVDCHGGDPEAHRDKLGAHAEAAGYRGTPDRRDVPALCSECHSDPLAMFAFALPTDQLAHYRTSAHGRAVLELGDAAAATCTDCHGTHDIRAAHDPRAPTAPANQPTTCGRCHADAGMMERFGLPADLVGRFEQSVHGRALLIDQSRGAPSCASCHGAHGASPPGVANVVQVCAECHPGTAESYRSSAHFANEEGMRCDGCHQEQAGLPGYQLNGCTACHGAHDIEAPGDEQFLGDEVGSCGHCHRTEDGAAAVVDAVISGRKRLEDAMIGTQQGLLRAKQAGLFLETEAVMLRESRSALVSLEPLSHALDVPRIEALVANGLERQDMAHKALERQQIVLRDRRILVVGWVLLLLMLACLMGAKLAAVRRLS
jgi:hypothetical protein